MFGMMLLMFVGGIGLTQAVSDPQQVTLRWLRLGGIIALSLLAVAATMHLGDPSSLTPDTSFILTCIAGCFVVQLITVQLALRFTQRVAAGCGFLTATLLVTMVMQRIVDSQAQLKHCICPPPMALGLSAALSGAVLGGYLMAMLLGHAFLTAGNEMTQRPLRRLVLILGIALALRAADSLVFGLRPYLASPAIVTSNVWNIAMVLARYTLGIAAPAVFTYLIYDCVKRAANQSATGILYVTLVLVILGEGISLALFKATAMVF